MGQAFSMLEYDNGMNVNYIVYDRNVNYIIKVSIT